MRICANAILRACLSSLDTLSLPCSKPVFINLVHTNPFGALLPSWLCVPAKIHFSCIHRLFACKYYMHASAYMQLCRTNLEQKSDLQWTPPKKPKQKNKPKEKTPSSMWHKLHLSNVLQSNLLLTTSMATGYCPPTSFKLLSFYFPQMILIITWLSAELKSQGMNHIISSVVWNLAFPCISSLLHGIASVKHVVAASNFLLLFLALQLPVSSYLFTVTQLP